MTTDSTRPRARPSTWLARRRTAMTSATSDSTAATTSPGEMRSGVTRRSRRLRDSASAGNASSASNAAVSRRPWPSLWRRWAPAASGRRADGRDGGGMRASTSAQGSAGAGAAIPLSAAMDVWLSRRPDRLASSGSVSGRAGRRRCARSASSRPSTASVSKMPGRDRRPGQRDADRLEDVLGLGAARLDDARAAPARRARRRTARRRASAVARVGERRRGRPSPSHFSRAFGSSAGPSKMKPASGQKSASVWIFSSRDRDRGAQARCGPVNASRRARELVDRQLAHVAAVQPAQLLLVELRRVARHALDAEALRRARRSR